MALLDYNSCLDVNNPIVLSRHADFNFSIDWLTFTYDASTASPKDDPFMNQVITWAFQTWDYFVVGKGRFGYRESLSRDGVIVLYSPDDKMTKTSKFMCSVIVTGDGMRFARSVLSEDYDAWLEYVTTYARITRLDLALDMFDADYSVVDRIWQCGTNHYCYDTIWRKSTFIQSSSAGQYCGNSLSFGTRNNFSYFRIYDKKAEQLEKMRPCDYLNWTRFELELHNRDKDINTFIHEYQAFDNNAAFDLFMSLLRGRLFIYGLPTFKSVDLANVAKAPLSVPSEDKPRPSLENSAFWLKRQWGDTLHRCIDAFPGFLGWLLGDNPPESSFEIDFIKMLMKVSPDVFI